MCRSEIGNKAVLPLRTFIQETLRRSRTSYSTLQVALYYLILIKPHVPKANCATDRYDDSFADQALQCGRRMFLAALILASKYLQDRNYSARAWSKISGLNTQEINQNEIAFLLAVNWKLHITDDIFRRWTDIVLKFTPSPLPPSPGAVSPTYVQQMANWKQLILSLEPQLMNVHGLVSAVQVSASANDLSVHTPRSILNHPQDHRGANTPEYAMISPKACTASAGAEAASHYACNAGRPAPVLGPLPTPRLTPRICGFNTPAASAPPQILGRPNSMGFAMAQVGSVNSTQTTLDRVVGWASSSPHGYCPIRRSSLANSVSTASSPESMVSDSSRSSSVSSVSSLASATIGSGNSRCGLPSRSRVAKLWSDRVSLKPSVPPVPEDIQEYTMAASPETYVGPEMGLGELALQTPLGRHESDLDAMARDPASDAARVLQDLHNYNTSMYARSSGRKRSRGLSMSGSLHGKMPEILNLEPTSAELSPSPLSQSHSSVIERHLAAPIIPTFGRSAKRVCCSAEAASGYQTATMHPAIGLRGRGMWDGILN